MATKQEVLHSPSKKRPKEDEHLHDAIAEMLQKQLSAIKFTMLAIVHEEILTISTRIDSLEKGVKLFSDRYDYCKCKPLCGTLNRMW